MIGIISIKFKLTNKEKLYLNGTLSDHWMDIVRLNIAYFCRLFRFEGSYLYYFLFLKTFKI